jgi:hypothetical protein
LVHTLVFHFNNPNISLIDRASSSSINTGTSIPRAVRLGSEQEILTQRKTSKNTPHTPNRNTQKKLAPQRSSKKQALRLSKVCEQIQCSNVEVIIFTCSPHTGSGPWADQE